ncbi:hypothetical protein ACHQM5_003481 [Ranunculus cassubicifolius]
MADNSRNYIHAHASMAMVQVLLGGFAVVTKVALNGGINQIVFTTYRDILALLILAPVAYFYEKGRRPPVTRHLLLSFFFLGLTGVCGNQVLFLVGLGYTSPTIAAAMQLTVPVLTFLLTVILGMEKLNLIKLEGKLKVGGILLLVAGALLMALLRGPTVLGSTLLGFRFDHWHIGVLSLVANCISFAIYLVLQGKIFIEFPTNLSVTAYSYLFGSIVMSILGLLSTHDATDWTLTPPQLLAVVYAGIVASAVCYGLSTWSNKILGPTLVSLYVPVQPLASAFLSTLFLRSPVYLGSIVGGILIIAGLYIFTWASHIERQQNDSEQSGLERLTEPLVLSI